MATLKNINAIEYEKKKLEKLLNEYEMDFRHTLCGWTNGHCFIKHHSLDVESGLFGAVEVWTEDMEHQTFLGWITDVEFLDALLKNLPANLN